MSLADPSDGRPDITIRGAGRLPEKPVREPHSLGDRPDRSARSSSPRSAPPAAPHIFHRSAYTFGAFASHSGSSFGMGIEIQAGFFAELDMESGMMTLGDFMSGGNSLSTGIAPASGSASLGFFGGSGSAQGFSGGGTSLGVTLTGPAGGLTASYTTADADAFGNVPYEGGALAYTYNATGAGAEVTTTRSQTFAIPRESININLDTHVRRWIETHKTPSMFNDW